VVGVSVGVTLVPVMPGVVSATVGVEVYPLPPLVSVTPDMYPFTV
jgi:hypothetical protein